MKNLRSILFVLFVSAISFTACEDDDSTQPSTPTTNNGGGTNPVDTSSKPLSDQFWLNSGTVKCTPYTKNFTQFINLISVNAEKCYQEFVRPNFTFDFQNSISPSTFTFREGNYNIVTSGTSPMADTDVVFSMSGYNGIQYTGISGTVTISKLATDTAVWVAEWDKINIYSNDDSTNYTFTGRLENF